MHMYAKCDCNLPCGSRVMIIIINLPRMEGWTDSHSDYSADKRVVQYTILLLFIICTLYNNIHCDILNVRRENQFTYNAQQHNQNETSVL